MIFPSKMKQSFRSLVWRISRKLYMWSRQDIANDPDSNGEYWLLQEILKLNVSSQVMLFDIGANKGDWSQRASNLLQKNQNGGSVFAFEPTLSTYEYLKRRFTNNIFIRTQQLALSNKVGRSDFFIVDDLSGINSLVLESLFLNF